MAGRSQFYEPIGYRDTLANNVYRVILTARVTVYVAPPFAAQSMTTLAAIFSAATGVGSPGNPFDATAGEASFFAGPGAYDVKIEDLAVPARFDTRTIRFESQPGDQGILAQMIAAGTISTSAIADGAVVANKIASGVIDYTKISDALKASVGATASTEALRAIGTGAGQVVSGSAPAFLAAGLTIGGDTNLYRSAANALKTDGTFQVGNAKTVGSSNTVGTLYGFTVDGANNMILGSTDGPNVQSLVLRGAASINFQVGTGGQHLNISSGGVLLFGSAFDTNLYRVFAGGLKTDGHFVVANGKVCGGVNTVGSPFGLTIDSQNNMSVGATDANNIAGLLLKGGQRITFQSGASFQGEYNTSGQFTATAFVVSSDQTLKKNVVTVGGGLAKVLALRGVEFDWKDEKGRGKGRRVGFLAQEVDRVVPGAAIELEDGTLGLNQSDVLPLLVEAFKELSTQVDALQKAA